MAQCHKRAFVTPPSKQAGSSTWTAPELTRSWSEDRPAQVSPPGQAGRNQPPNVSDLPPTRPTLAPPFTLARGEALDPSLPHCFPESKLSGVSSRRVGGSVWLLPAVASSAMGSGCQFPRSFTHPGSMAIR